MMSKNDLLYLNTIASRIASRKVRRNMKQYRAAQARALKKMSEAFGVAIEPQAMQLAGCAPDCPRCYERRVSYILGRLVRRRVKRILNTENDTTKL